ncbi:IPT/TIG domain-containing protein [Lacinutrix cladophorae]
MKKYFYLFLLSLVFTCANDDETIVQTSTTNFPVITDQQDELLIPNTSYRINGSGFNQNTSSSYSVYFNTVEAEIIEVTEEYIEVLVPEDAISGDLILFIDSEEYHRSSILVFTEHFYVLASISDGFYTILEINILDGSVIQEITPSILGPTFYYLFNFDYSNTDQTFFFKTYWEEHTGMGGDIYYYHSYNSHNKITGSQFRDNNPEYPNAQYFTASNGDFYVHRTGSGVDNQIYHSNVSDGSTAEVIPNPNNFSEPVMIYNPDANEMLGHGTSTRFSRFNIDTGEVFYTYSDVLRPKDFDYHNGRLFILNPSTLYETSPFDYNAIYSSVDMETNYDNSVRMLFSDSTNEIFIINFDDYTFHIKRINMSTMQIVSEYEVPTTYYYAYFTFGTN